MIEPGGAGPFGGERGEGQDAHDADQRQEQGNCPVNKFVFQGFPPLEMGAGQTFETVWQGQTVLRFSPANVKYQVVNVTLGIVCEEYR